MWCQLTLAMPFLSLGLFLVLPWQWALPGYLPIAVGSLLLYRTLMRDLHAPPQVGSEALLGARVKVLEVLPPGSRGKYLVRLGSERWTARARGELCPGDEARVVGLDGICLLLDGMLGPTPAGSEGRTS